MRSEQARWFVVNEQPWPTACFVANYAFALQAVPAHGVQMWRGICGSSSSTKRNFSSPVSAYRPTEAA